MQAMIEHHPRRLRRVSNRDNTLAMYTHRIWQVSMPKTSGGACVNRDSNNARPTIMYNIIIVQKNNCTIFTFRRRRRRRRRQRQRRRRRRRFPASFSRMCRNVNTRAYVCRLRYDSEQRVGCDGAPFGLIYRRFSAFVSYCRRENIRPPRIIIIYIYIYFYYRTHSLARTHTHMRIISQI